MRYVSLSALLVVAATSVLDAQTPTIESGMQVRVWSAAQNRYTYSGRVSALAADTLTIARGGSLFRVPVAWYDRVEVKVPRSRGWGALRGAGIGVLTGAIVGTAMYSLAMSQCRPGDDLCGLTFYYVPAGVVLGAPTGALIGTAFPGSRWQAATQPPSHGR
jgi:hypothetical protein